jgi:phosphatidylserine/phosphatidylglycerophosphate/cardiolipin synthase-like enzyme
LAAAGVPIWIDDRARLAHAKTMVIDGVVTLQGSYNWIRAAALNSEDLNLISSPSVAGVYAAHWRQRLASRRHSSSARTGAGLHGRKRSETEPSTAPPMPSGPRDGRSCEVSNDATAHNG